MQWRNGGPRISVSRLPTILLYSHKEGVGHAGNHSDWEMAKMNIKVSSLGLGDSRRH